MPDDGKERERETVTVGEAARIAVAAAACAFCKIGSCAGSDDRPVGWLFPRLVMDWEKKVWPTVVARVLDHIGQDLSSWVGK